MSTFINSIFLREFSQIEQWDEWVASESKGIPGIILAGRSNVGKSSLINALFKTRLARTSKTPGRTKAIIIFQSEFVDPRTEEKKPFFVYDLPGFGHAKISKQERTAWDQLLGHFFEYIGPENCLLFIQDARHPNQQMDQLFFNFISSSHITTYLTLNKIDKLKTQKERSVLKKLLQSPPKNFKLCEQIHQISAISSEGIEQLELSLITFLLNHYPNLNS